MDDILLLLILVPLLGAIAGMFVPATWERSWALFVSLINLGLGIAIALSFQYHDGGLQFAYTGFSAPDIWVNFNLGMDAISLWLVLLTVLLMPLAILASFDSITQRTREYYAWMLVLLAAMLGVFLSRNLIVFYIFFELTLIPMFFIIGIWGGPQRRYAAGKFFLFTFTGSVFTLAAVLYLGSRYGTLDISELVMAARYGSHYDGMVVDALSSTARFWVLLGLLAGFSVKVPLFPVHTWLPLAHTEAPTAGSVILAGVLLKLGTYGLLRLALPIGLLDAHGVAFPQLLKLVGALCVIGIIYGALIAWLQQDIKKLVAYSSVSHLGFCVLGMLALNPVGLQGSVLYMINHGLSTGALFLCVGMIYDRYHTRDINQLSGLAKRMPKLAFFMVLFTFASIGVPGLNGFVSEFLTILGAFTSDYLGWRFGALAAVGIILGAVYMLHLLARIIWGPLKTPEHGHDPQTPAPFAHNPDSHASTSHSPTAHEPIPGDISPREIAILVPLAIAVVLLGVMPAGVMHSMVQPINDLLAPVATVATNTPTHTSDTSIALAAPNR
jgi:NADH-quinone oxidoreductase subunit M